MKPDKLPTLFLVSLVVPFLLGVSLNYGMVETSALSIDKGFKGLLVFLGLLIFLNCCKGQSINKEINSWLYPSFFILFLLFLNACVDFNSALNTSFSFKEVVRVFGFVVILFLVANLSWRYDYDCIFFVRCFAFVGCLTGIFCVYYSNTVQIEQSWRMIGQYVRAGDQSVDPNSLSAFLNFTTFLSLAGFFIAKHKFEKVLYVLAISVEQMGRFFTFSNGGHLNLAIAFIVLLYLFKKLNKNVYRKILLVFSVIVSIFLGVFFLNDGLQILFYRLSLSDDYVAAASIYSRLDQYYFFFNYFYDNPQYLLLGLGNLEYSALSPYGLEIHNSQMRALSGTGVFGLAAYLFLIFLALKSLYIVFQSNNYNQSVISIFVCSAFIGWLFQSATIPSDTSVMHWCFLIVSSQIYFGFRRQKVTHILGRRNSYV